jgi:arylmalonate decarboxylase
MTANAHPERIYGQRCRIGLLVPSSNTVCEIEFWQMAPPGISVHTSRMPFFATRHQRPLDEMETHLDRVFDEAKTAVPDVIAYGCTASSAKGDAMVKERELAEQAGVPTATAAAALVEALRALGATRIAMLTPYPPETNAKEVKFFAENGIEVLAEESIIVDEAQLSFRNMCLVPAERLIERAVALGSDERVEAVVLSCADMPTAGALPAIEAELDKPVISSVQALFWRALRLAGIDDPVPNAGRLLAM